jgi:predicted O-methyltransferase YrrM
MTENHSVPESFEEAWQEIQSIGGWLTDDQARTLYDVARRVDPSEAIVEIGSHHGRSTVVLATAKHPDVRLLAIDPYGDPRWGGGGSALEIFQGNLQRHGVADRVELARTVGSDAGRTWSGGPVGLLFVDGAHDYPTVIKDLEAWVPHLAPNAAVLMHDVGSSHGVTRAAFRHAFASRSFLYVGCSRSLAQFKYTDLSGGEALASSLRMLRELPWMGRNLAIKLAKRRGWTRTVNVIGYRDSRTLY